MEETKEKGKKQQQPNKLQLKQQPDEHLAFVSEANLHPARRTDVKLVVTWKRAVTCGNKRVINSPIARGLK